MIYEEEFANNKFEGEGKYYFENGEIYIGNFKNDRFHGQGMIIKIDGSVKYEGEFVNNKPDRCIIFKKK